MEEFIPPDVLAMLPHQVAMERQQRKLPINNTGNGKTFSDSFRVSTGSDGEGDEYMDLLKNVYHDQHAQNYSQKEKVATKILKGEYNVSEQYEPSGDQNRGYDPFHHQAHSNAILKRHQLNHRMFEVTSQPAAFHCADPVAKKTLAQSRIRKIGRGPQHFMSLGIAVPAVPLHVPAHKEKQKINFPSRSDIVSRQILTDADKVKQFRGNIRDQKGEYEQQKRREIEIRKKTAAFKERLFLRLKEKRDPQLTSIMRTVDDSVIFSFIDSYKGCTMSIDAILMHIGANVKCSPSSTVDAHQIELAAPVPGVKSAVDSNGYHLVARESKCKGAGFRQVSRSPANPDQFISRPSSPSQLSVQAMHTHLSAEHLLPSMQPDKAISDSELERLGAHSTSCDQLRRSAHPLGKVEVPSRRLAPRSLRTPQHQAATDQHAAVSTITPAARPTLSSTNYGGMYVVSSFKDSVS